MKVKINPNRALELAAAIALESRNPPNVGGMMEIELDVDVLKVCRNFQVRWIGPRSRRKKLTLAA